MDSGDLGKVAKILSFCLHKVRFSYVLLGALKAYWVTKSIVHENGESKFGCYALGLVFEPCVGGHFAILLYSARTVDTRIEAK